MSVSASWEERLKCLPMKAEYLCRLQSLFKSSHLRPPLLPDAIHIGLRSSLKTLRGEQVVQLVQELKPDLVILDITMPRMSRLEAASRMRKLRLDVPVLILHYTSLGETGHRGSPELRDTS